VGYQKNLVSNLKSYLYKQILVSIRLNIQSKYAIQPIERTDFAAILYNKKVTTKFKILDKTKFLALENDEKLMACKL
jgi:hypothetical protein